MELSKDGEGKLSCGEEYNLCHDKDLSTLSQSVWVFRKRKILQNLFTILNILLFLPVWWPVVQVTLIKQARSDSAPSPASGRSPTTPSTASRAIYPRSHSPFLSHLICCDCLAGPATPTALPKRMSDPAGASPTYTGGHHFVLATILWQGTTVLWQGTAVLLNNITHRFSYCDWLTSISWIYCIQMYIYIYKHTKFKVVALLYAATGGFLLLCAPG